MGFGRVKRGLRRTLALAMLLACGVAAAEVVQEDTERPYTAPIAEGQSLRAALNAATPIRQDGKPFHAYTAWNVHWNFWWYSEANGRCRITRVRTRLTTTVQLPQLQGGTPAQQAVFERYARALRHHEQGHVQWGRDAAHAIDRGIAALPTAQDCAGLERQANALGQRLLAEHMARERDYDRSTGHGTTQGAQLLPHENAIK